MFYIVIGQSGSGKTTYVRNNFLQEPYIIIDKYPVVCTMCANGVIALGRYGIERREQGTDTLAYNAKEKIKRTLYELRSKDVVLEGDRIANADIFEYIRLLGVQVRLIMCICSLSTSMCRLRSNGSRITKKFVKCTRTKSKNLYLKYCAAFNGVIIDTEKHE